MPHRVIGIICSSEGWGGLELNTLRLAGWLRGRGWKVHLLASGAAPIVRERAGHCNSVTTFADSGKPARAGQLRQIHPWVRRYKIRVLFVPFNGDIAVASLYKRFYDRSIGLVYQQHMQVGVRKRDVIHTLRYAMLDAWIAPLQYLKEETLRLTRVPPSKIEVIPFGIDPEMFTAAGPDRHEARECLQLPQDEKIIGVLGRLDPGKGQDFIVRALKALRDSGHVDYSLLIMGNATLNDAGAAYAGGLRSLVADADLQDAVYFRPHSADVLTFFRAIDVFAMPAHHETYGMVTIEAMAAGVPVIGTDSGGTRELLGGGRYGYLFERENVAHFCSQLVALVADPDAPQRLKAAQGAAFTQYSYRKTVADIDALLYRVASGE